MSNQPPSTQGSSILYIEIELQWGAMDALSGMLMRPHMLDPGYSLFFSFSGCYKLLSFIRIAAWEQKQAISSVQYYWHFSNEEELYFQTVKLILNYVIMCGLICAA